MNISQKGLDLIAKFEGLRLEAYAATADEKKRGIWTIGYGSTSWPNGEPVRQGDKLSDKEEAVDLLVETVRPRVEAVNQLVDVPLSQNQFDALVSFVYNVGIAAFRGSTLRRVLNNGDYIAAAGQFQRWNKQSGKVLPGLVNRRRAEQDLFLKGMGGCGC